MMLADFRRAVVLRVSINASSFSRLRSFDVGATGAGDVDWGAVREQQRLDL